MSTLLSPNHILPLLYVKFLRNVSTKSYTSTFDKKFYSMLKRNRKLNYLSPTPLFLICKYGTIIIICIVIFVENKHHFVPFFSGKCILLFGPATISHSSPWCLKVLHQTFWEGNWAREVCLSFIFCIYVAKLKPISGSISYHSDMRNG